MYNNNKRKTLYFTLVSIAMVVMLTFVVVGIIKNSNKTVISNQTAVNGEVVENKVTADLEGGSGKAHIEDAVIYNDNGELSAKITWSSENYDYMIVDGNKYLPLNETGNSVFQFPIKSEDYVDVIADTTAMGNPHEIEYTIKFSKEKNSEKEGTSNKTENEGKAKIDSDIEAWKNNHNLTTKLEREYAVNFSILEYDNEYYILKIKDQSFLLLKNGIDRPADYPEGANVINIPIENAYVVSSGAIDYFAALDSIDSIKYISVKENDIENEKVKLAVGNKKISYAGKYSAPDYEMLIANGCDVIIENTMIYHKPEVLEKLKTLGFLALVEESNLEEHPIGRMEWIKLFGFLTDKYDEAVQIFNEKKALMERDYKETNKRVAYFYINSTGAVVVRKNNDYIPRLIEMAGGEYALSKNQEYNGSGTMNVQAESFYSDVATADYFIYNSSIAGEIKTIDELVKKCPVLQNTTAVKNGNVFCNDGNYYQSVMSFAEITDDINKMLNGETELKFLNKLER